jgi:hypothetical protein
MRHFDLRQLMNPSGEKIQENAESSKGTDLYWTARFRLDPTQPPIVD